MEYSYFGKEQKVDYEKLDNGLGVYIIPNKNATTFSINYVVKYGGDIKEYIPINQKSYTNIVSGLAHFLEHKKFDMESGDAIDWFSKYGAYTNAGTSNTYTKYYVVGKKYFKKCLEQLTNVVFTPYFTDYTVQNEMGIIGEEISMYNDEPEWILEKNFREGLFKNIMALDIAGTKESISQITKEKLMEVYDTFYQPSNTILIISGNVKKKDILETLKNNVALNQRKTKEKIFYKKDSEPDNVVFEYKKLSHNIIYPKIKYGFKINLDHFTIKDYLKEELYLNMLFEILLGDASDFNDYNLVNKLSNWYYNHMGIAEDNIYCYSMYAESECADLLVNKIDNIFKNSSNYVTEEAFDRIKKSWYSSSIRCIDDTHYLADIIIYDLLKFNKIVDYRELIDELSYEELRKMLQELDLSNKTLVLMIPDEDKKK